MNHNAILAISGSRHFSDYSYISNILSEYDLSDCIIHVGDAKGVDSCVRNYCKEHNIPHKIFYADWHKFGNSAGPIRNQSMICDASHLIAFPSKDSKGTIHAIKYAESLGIYVEIYNI